MTAAVIIIRFKRRRKCTGVAEGCIVHEDADIPWDGGRPLEGRTL